jgi:hypothetical protein
MVARCGAGPAGARCVEPGWCSAIKGRWWLVDLHQRPSALGQRAVAPESAAVGAPYPTDPDCLPPRPGLSRFHLGRSDSIASRGWPGWVHYRPLGWRGRPSPTGRHARLRRDRPCRVPTDYPVVPPRTTASTTARCVPRNRPKLPAARDRPDGSSFTIEQPGPTPPRWTTRRPGPPRHAAPSRAGGRRCTGRQSALGQTRPDGSGPPDSPSAPGRDGLVGNGRAPKSGTAAPATPGVGSEPKPATMPTGGVGADAGVRMRHPGRVWLASRPEVTGLAHERRIAPTPPAGLSSREAPLPVRRQAPAIKGRRHTPMIISDRHVCRRLRC